MFFWFLRRCFTDFWFFLRFFYFEENTNACNFRRGQHGVVLLLKKLGRLPISEGCFGSFALRFLLRLRGIFSFLRGLSWFFDFYFAFHGGLGGILRSFLRFYACFLLLVRQWKQDFRSEVLKKSAFSPSKLAKYRLWLLFGAILMNCSALLAGFGIFLVVCVISNDFFLWLERFFLIFLFFHGFWEGLPSFERLLSNFGAFWLLFRLWQGFCSIFCFLRLFIVDEGQGILCSWAAGCLLYGLFFACFFVFGTALRLLFLVARAIFILPFDYSGGFCAVFLTARAIFVRFLKKWLVLFTKD